MLGQPSIPTLHTSDARSFHAVLTKAGSERLAEARVTHDEVIDEMIGSRLSESRLASVARTLSRVAQR
jgi:DNA-binding MarR family transcriptional regulator